MVSSLFAFCLPALAQGSCVAQYTGTSSPTSNVCSQTGAGECKVSATMVWTPAASNPSEPPPKSAIVSVSGKANVAGGPGTPSCDDGSGAACTIYPMYLGGYGSVEGAAHYSVKSDPGASFSIDAKPTVKLPGTVTGGSRRAELSVSVTPVTVGLAGTTPVGATLKVLTGQQVKAALFAGYTVVAGVAKSVYWAWKN